MSDKLRRPNEVAGGANEPQHMPGDYGENRPLPPQRDGLPTTKDPHPSNEEQYDKQRRPGGAEGIKDHDIGTNDAVHDGTPKKRPPPRPGASG